MKTLFPFLYGFEYLIKHVVYFKLLIIIIVIKHYA